MATYKILGYLADESKTYDTFAEAIKAFNEITDELRRWHNGLHFVSRVCCRVYHQYIGYTKYAGTMYIKKVN